MTQPTPPQTEPIVPAVEEPITYPATGTPLLQVEFVPGITETERAICARYWAVTPDGTWAEKVASIGPATRITKVVADQSRALLLTEPCNQCGEPMPAGTRHQVQAIAGPLFARHKTATWWFVCKPCQDAQDEALDSRVQDRARARAREEAELRALQITGPATSQTVADFLASEADRTADTEERALIERHDGRAPLGPTVLLAVAAAAITFASSSPGAPIPSLSDFPRGWTGQALSDAEALGFLHACNWLAVHPATPREAFGLNGHGEFTFDTRKARWRLLPTVEDACRLLADESRLYETVPEWGADGLSPLDWQIRHMQMVTVIDHLKELLIREFRGSAVPREAMPRLRGTIRDGLDSGLTCGQMITLARRAVHGAAEWRTRKGLSGHPAAVAVVTFLSGEIDKAITYSDQVPEEHPAQGFPPALNAARNLARHLARTGTT